MMARSFAPKGPDTLAQDQFTIPKASCDARPVHTNGSNWTVPPCFEGLLAAGDLPFPLRLKWFVWFCNSHAALSMT
jgi:hypothetical protein